MAEMLEAALRNASQEDELPVRRLPRDWHRSAPQGPPADKVTPPNQWRVVDVLLER